jgi:hypothetical protein
LPVQAPSAQDGSLQLPPAQLNTHVAPASHVALGQTEPPLTHVKLQLEPSWHVTARPAQLPESLQEKSQVLPAPHVATPLQMLPPPSHSKSQSAPGWHTTSAHLPEPWQSKAQTEAALHTVPLQLLPPPEQSNAQVAPVSQTTS